MNAAEEREHERRSLHLSIAQVRTELEHAVAAGGDLTAIKKTLDWFEQSLAKLPAIP